MSCLVLLNIAEDGSDVRNENTNLVFLIPGGELHSNGFKLGCQPQGGFFSVATLILNGILSLHHKSLWITVSDKRLIGEGGEEEEGRLKEKEKDREEWGGDEEEVKAGGVVCI